MNPAEPAPSSLPAEFPAEGTDGSSHQYDPARRRRLRWRARRGLLENDLVLTRFLDSHEASLTDADVVALDRLLDCTDNELMDLILERSEPSGELASPAVRAMVDRLRAA